MKFIHTADLHIGKTVNEFSMLEEQRHVLKQIEKIAVEEQAEAVVIAGDVYDRSVPSTEAVMLLDLFLTSLSEAGIPVILISGNHDSGERVAFADRILEKQGLYIAGGYDGHLKQVTFRDEWGNVVFTCMPFVKPAVATVEEMLSATPMTLDLMTRRVLVTHYFVTGEDGQQPELSDSETTVNVGGLDNVSASFFAAFDYVALGHIHKRQRIGERQVWYAGAPLKYSFSEVSQQKSVNVVTLGRKGEVTVEAKALTPLHDFRIIEGKLKQLILPEVVEAADKEDYIKAILTDTEELVDPIGTLRSVYPHVMLLERKRPGERETGEYEEALSMSGGTPGELFTKFYELLNEEPMDERRLSIIEELDKVLKEGGYDT